MKRLILTAVLCLPSALVAQTVTDCSTGGTHSINGNQYIYQQNEWNSTQQQCVSINTTTGDFTITSANFNLSGGAPATYPSIFKGCHWGNCTTNRSEERRVG